jgi:hypothetical protein
MSDSDTPDMPDLPPGDPSLPRSRRRVVIPATCHQHRGVGCTNFLVTLRGGEIVLDPHVDGSCVITLDEKGASTLRDTLTQWLG